TPADGRHVADTRGADRNPVWAGDARRGDHGSEWLRRNVHRNIDVRGLSVRGDDRIARLDCRDQTGSRNARNALIRGGVRDRDIRRLPGDILDGHSQLLRRAYVEPNAIQDSLKDERRRLARARAITA